MAGWGDFPHDQFDDLSAFSPGSTAPAPATTTKQEIDDFPVDQFADLSMFSSAVTVASFDTELKQPQPQSKVKSPKAAASPTANTEQTSPLLQPLATALVGRLYSVTLQLRNDIEQRTLVNSLQTRTDEATFAAVVAKHVNLTVLQELYHFSDEKKAEFEQVWTHYSLYKRTKAKDTMSKRQYTHLMAHWLQALVNAENATTIRSLDLEEVDREPDLPSSKASRLFGKSKSAKPAETSLRANREILEELYQMCLFGVSSMLSQAEALADISWDRIYAPDATDFTPRVSPSGSTEGSQSMFVLNFVASLSNLKSRNNALPDRTRLTALCDHYGKLLKDKLAIDVRQHYAKQLARSGLI